MLLPGFWSEASKTWVEDDYQVGSATGNLAWAALALLTASERSSNPSYVQAATKLMRWIDAHTAGVRDIGYTGGTFGHEPAPAKLEWKSTEHNLDVYAVAGWLAEIEERAPGRRCGTKHANFLMRCGMNSRDGFTSAAYPEATHPARASPE